MSTVTKRVLVVEDDENLKTILVDRLAGQYLVDDAIDGEMAVRRLNSNKYDLVMLDLMIPMVNGYELLGQMRSSENEDLSKVPVIILSNLASKESIDRAEALGISAYFIKANVNVEEVIAKAKHILERP